LPPGRTPEGVLEAYQEATCRSEGKSGGRTPENAGRRCRRMTEHAGRNGGERGRTRGDPRGRQPEEATEGGRSPAGRPMEESTEGRTPEARPEGRREGRNAGRKEGPKEGSRKDAGRLPEGRWKAAGRTLEGCRKLPGGGRKEGPEAYRSHVPNDARSRREDARGIRRFYRSTVLKQALNILTSVRNNNIS